MAKKKISHAQLDILNSKHGLYHLLKHKDLDIERAIEEASFTLAMREEQEKLIHLQNWVIEHDQKVVILFEGRDVAGKGGAIKKITEHINPRHYRVAALSIPTEDEQKQWFFQRYITQLPKPGEMVFFDRSWYNRAVVEPVNGFCTKKEYKRFMSQVNDFEKMVVQSDTYLLKLFFSIKKKEQARRFAAIEADPMRQWQLTPVDRQAQALWEVYTRYEKKMFARTDTAIAPWRAIDANKQDQARLEAIRYIIDRIPYTRKRK